MTILCASTTGLYGVRPCSIRGEHKISCPDRPVNRAIVGHLYGPEVVLPEVCGGCLPRPAERGFLCARCYDRVENAYARWGRFVRLLRETDGRAVSPENGGVKSAAADGYTNLALTFLAVDECEGYLETLAGLTVDAWVHTLDGARDALSFAAAAESAYRSLEVEERARTIERVRCPHCRQLTITGNNTREVRGKIVVECQHCGHVLDEITPDITRWIGSELCESGGHERCGGVHCQCDCHNLGWFSQTTGVAALWDADLHAKAPDSAQRALWVVEKGRVQVRPVELRRESA